MIHFDNYFELWAEKDGKELFRFREPNLVTNDGVLLCRDWLVNESVTHFYIGLQTTRPSSTYILRNDNSETARAWREINSIPNSFLRPEWVPNQFVDSGMVLSVRNSNPVEWPSWPTATGTVVYSIRGLFITGSTTLDAVTPYPDFLSSSTTLCSGMPPPLFEARINTPFDWDFNQGGVSLFATYQLNYRIQP